MANLTAKQMIPAVGHVVLLRSEQSFQFSCRVLDVKCAYGNVRLLLTPSDGTGTQWVDLSRVQVIETTTITREQVLPQTRF